MATYGITLYGKDKYGSSGPQTIFSADPMAAQQTDYGVLQVTWATPSQAGGATWGAWTRQRLVRNSYGVPDSEIDGAVLLDEAAGATSNQYLDSQVVPGQFYYYAVFVQTGVNTYSSTAVYQPGDLTVYSGTIYQCLAANTTGVTPGTNAAIWLLDPGDLPWVRCGAGTVGLVARSTGYQQMLYDLVPLPYKVATVETTASNVPVNDDLYDFTSVFGFYLDVMKAENDALLRMNDIHQCTDRQLALIAQQMGIDDRLPAMPELRRTFVRDANQIQRGSGSAASMAQLMQDLTGWVTTATSSYNMMPTVDSATFSSSVAEPWNPYRFYMAGASATTTYDVVTYSGSVYAAKANTSVVSCYLLSSSAITYSGGGVSYVRDPLAGVKNKGYVEYLSPGLGGSVTFTLTPNTNLTGTPYNLYVRFVKDPSGGQVSCTINGSSVLGWSRDLYAPARQPDDVVFIASGSYGAGTTIQFTVTGQNPLASSFNVFVMELRFQSVTVAQNLGIPPAGNAQSATMWTTSIGTNELPDIDTERNYLTDGQNIWNIIDSAGNTNGRPDNYLGPNPTTTLGVIPLGDSVGTGAPGNGGSLSYQLNSTGVSGKVTVQTCGYVYAPGWSNLTPYMSGQPVTWGIPNTVPTPIYVAKNYTYNNQPDQNTNKWEIRQYSTSAVNGTDPLLLPKQAILLPQVQVWQPSVAYAKGQVVRWRSTLYQAAQPVPLGASPSGYNADTAFWRWLGPSSQVYTFSAYHYRTTTATGVNVRPGLDFYDANGNFLGHAGSVDGKTQVWDGFNNYAATWPSSSIATPPTGWATPPAWRMGQGVPWVYTWGSWGPVDDMAVPTGWNSVSTTTVLLQKSAGRILWFDRQWLYSGGPLDTIYATFRSAPFDPTYTMEHGIAFRYASANGYWLASRDRLSYTVLTFSSGALTNVANTVMATWTPITDGTRMKVTTTSSTVTVYAMTSAQPGVWVQLATVSSTQFNTQTGVGLLERIHL